MIRHSIITLGTVSAIIFLMASACAKEESTSPNEGNKRYLDSWIAINHPGAKTTPLGAYIISEEVGAGESVGKEDSFLFARYTTTDLEGNVQSTTEKQIARQVGTFDHKNYYGEQVLINDTGYTEAGVLDMLRGMRVGGTRTAVIPGWLNVKEDHGSAQEYLDNCTGKDVIYKVTLVGKCNKIQEWETALLEDYSAKHLNGTDSTQYGYYYMQTKAPTGTSAMPNDTTFYINYTGRLLNGQVFDTTIEDTAKVHGIYSSSKKYVPVDIKKAEKHEDITMGSASGGSGTTLVKGFSLCLSNLKKHEKGICAFYSTLGYGYTGSGNSIPKFAPIVFEIEVVDKP